MSWYTFFSWIINMSLTGSIVILVVVLARLCLKRAPKAVSYGLWAVVLFRLLCPVTIASDFSLLGFWDTAVKEAALGNRLEYISVEKAPVGNMPGADHGIPSEPTDAGIFQENDENMYINAAINNINVQKSDDSADANVVVSVEHFVVAEKLMPVAVMWLLGIGGMLLYEGLSVRRLRRSLVGAVRWKDNIFQSDYIASPFVMGLLRPRIYLPSGLGERERSYILLHEQFHIRRLDHVAKMLAFLVLCIHWFNPLVWLAFFLFEKDMEMSCDEAVIGRMGAEIRADYSASLLGLATGRRGIAGMPLAFGESSTRGRIRNLAKWKRPAFWGVAVAVAGCVALAVGLMTNPKEDTGYGASPENKKLSAYNAYGHTAALSMEEAGPLDELLIFYHRSGHPVIGLKVNSFTAWKKDKWGNYSINFQDNTNFIITGSERTMDETYYFPEGEGIMEMGTTEESTSFYLQGGNLYKLYDTNEEHFYYD